jgi:ATP-dependent Lon protease
MTYADIYKTKSGTLNELRQLRASHAKKVDDDSATKLVTQGRNADSCRATFKSYQHVTTVFNRSKLFELIQEINLEKLITDGRRRELADYERLYASPSERVAADLADGYENQLGDLAAYMPNMSKVINDIIAPELAVNNFKTQRGFLIQPLLLVGPAGCGKSYLASALSGLMNTPTLELKAETQQSSASLCGGAKHWSNAQAGALFNLVSKTTVSNGIIFIDEVDKTRGAGDYPFINALYALLEPTTASKFTDNACPDITLDLSQLSWIFTANTAEGIPQPLLSRLNVVELSALTKSEARNVAHAIFSKQCELYLGHNSGLEISASALDVLQLESPRKQTLMLRTGIGKVLLEKGRQLNSAHLPRASKDSAPRIGFI